MELHTPALQRTQVYERFASFDPTRPFSMLANINSFSLGENNAR